MASKRVKTETRIVAVTVTWDTGVWGEDADCKASQWARSSIGNIGFQDVTFQYVDLPPEIEGEIVKRAQEYHALGWRGRDEQDRDKADRTT